MQKNNAPDRISAAKKNDIIRNADYGTGRYIRHLQFKTLDKNTLEVSLADDCHAVKLHIQHNASTIIDISGQWHRHPNSTCAGAINAIQTLAGIALSDNIFQLREHTDAKSHCTHLFDLTRFASAHIQQQREDRTYKIEVDDHLSENSQIRLTINNNPVLLFTTHKDHFTLPDFMQGAPKVKGLSYWAREHLNKEQQELAIMVQMAQFVAYSRKLDLNAMAGNDAGDAGPPLGSCYALQPQRAKDGIRLASQRILSDDADYELSFTPHDVNT